MMLQTDVTPTLEDTISEVVSEPQQPIDLRQLIGQVREKIHDNPKYKDLRDVEIVSRVTLMVNRGDLNVTHGFRVIPGNR
jgi:hypothetical protein